MWVLEMWVLRSALRIPFPSERSAIRGPPRRPDVGPDFKRFKRPIPSSRLRERAGATACPSGRTVCPSSIVTRGVRNENRFQIFTSYLRYVFFQRLHVREPATTMHRPLIVTPLLDAINTDLSSRQSPLFRVSLATGMAFHRAISRTTDLPMFRRPPLHSSQPIDPPAPHLGC